MIGRCFDYLPGQFQFITFHCQDKEVPVEEHHWTISSTPTRQGFVTSTIKESGDFTSKLSRIQPGDTAEIIAPFGRFSYLLHEPADEVVMIAGGIGITPLMAMIRHMRDTGSDRSVLLMYANRTEQDIVFREELREMESAGTPRLSVVHVLEHPDESWEGPQGRIDTELIARFCGDVDRKSFYICAPPPMTAAIMLALSRLAAHPGRIYTERFAL